jgi:hypothetical protein
MGWSFQCPQNRSNMFVWAGWLAGWAPCGWRLRDELNGQKWLSLNGQKRLPLNGQNGYRNGHIDDREIY